MRLAGLALGATLILVVLDRLPDPVGTLIRQAQNAGQMLERNSAHSDVATTD
jgi:hypothetical protein